MRPAWSGNSGGRRNAGSRPPSTPAAPASPARAPSACLGAGGRRSERPRTKRKVGAARRARRGIGWAGGVAKGSGLREESRGTGALRFTKQKRKHKTKPKTSHPLPPPRKSKALTTKSGYSFYRVLGVKESFGQYSTGHKPWQSSPSALLSANPRRFPGFSNCVSTLLMGCRSRIAGLWLAF